MLHTPTNSVLGSFGDLNVVERFYQSIPFIAGFAIEINETNLFDDIVLPFPSYLERFDFNAGTSSRQLGPCGQDDWFWQIRQPVVEPAPGLRHPQEIIMELAEKVGILDDFYQLLNHTFRLKEPYALEAGRRYSPPETIDRISRCWFGEEHDLKWFQEHGVIRYQKEVEETYIGPFLKARLPIYLEHFLQRGEELKEVIGQMGLDWDFSDYTPLSEWMPCPSYNALQKGDYDLIAVHYKFPYVYGAFGNDNPWINEICEQTNAYHIILNEEVAKAKGIQDNDEVWLESPVCKVRAKAKLTQCIHPQVVGVGGHFGHWAPGMPIAQGKGVNFNSLLPTDLDHIDKISTALDHCVQVRVSK